MLINHSEKFGMLLANNIDTENGEPAGMNFIKDNFGNSLNHVGDNCIYAA